MIPVALPSVEALLLVAFLLATTLLWVIWTLSLLARYARGRWRRPAMLPYGLATAIALFTLWQSGDFYLQMRAYDRERAASYRPELREPLRLGQIDMPRGTKLELAVANTAEAFNRAVFPHPVRVANVDAVEITRYIAIKTNENYETVGFTPQTMRVTGNGVTLQSGWRCDATQPVEFDLAADGNVSGFSRCILADGNIADGIVLPKGTSLRASTGNVYTDGFVDSDRWVLDTAEGQTVRIDNFALEDVTLALDARRQIYEIRSGVLSEEVMAGAFRYAAGSGIRFNPRHIRADYPGAWLITPSSASGGSAPVSPRSTVLSRGGVVLATLSD